MALSRQDQRYPQVVPPDYELTARQSTLLVLLSREHRGTQLALEPSVTLKHTADGRVEYSDGSAHLLKSSGI